MKTLIKLIITSSLILISFQGTLFSQEDIFSKKSITAGDISDHIQQLSATVGKSVVQIFVTSYTPMFKWQLVLYSKMRGSGLGIILDPDGYIVTNYHVVEGAVRVKVVVTKDFGNDEAAYFVKDIRYMFNVARTLDRHS